MAESDIKVIDVLNVSKDVHNNKNTEKQTDEVKLDRNTEDTKETNNDNTISLKSFKIMDEKHRREDQSKIDNDVITNRNQNNSEDIQEEVIAPKCYTCIYEVSEFLPWFCINIGRWCSNSFKRNCCFCCNKKVIKRSAFDEEEEEYWHGNIINEGDLTRYSLPVCIDDDGKEDDSIKIKFHRNEDLYEDDDIKKENVDFEKCYNVNIDMNKESAHNAKTDDHDDNHRSKSHGHCDVQSYSQGNISHDHYNDLNKCENENKGVSDSSKGNDYDTKTGTHDYNHHRHSDLLKNSHGVSSYDYYNDCNKYDNINKEDIHMPKGSDHDSKTVTHDDNHRSYGHGNCDVLSSSHDITSDGHVSHDNTPSYTDTGYSGGDVGGCDTGGFSSDW